MGSVSLFTSAQQQQPQFTPPIVRAATYTAYDPATFVLTFPQNFKPIFNVSSLTNGLFTYTVSTTAPLSTLEAFLNSSAVYNIVLVLNYPVFESGNITWDLFSPALYPGFTGAASFSNDTSVGLNWQMTLTPNLTPASPQQIANATSALINYDMQKIQAEQQREIVSNQAAINYQFDILYIILGVYGVVQSVVVIERLFRRREN